MKKLHFIASRLIPMINEEVARHATGNITYKCDAVLTEFRVVKEGSDAAHVAVTTAATDQPMGITEQATDAAEDLVNVEMFGASLGTKKVEASAAILKGARICGTAGGKVVTLPAAAGTYWVCGIANTAASAAGAYIEIIPCTPYPVVVAEAES